VGDNSVYKVNNVGVSMGTDNPHGNAFLAEETLLAPSNISTTCEWGERVVLARGESGQEEIV